jgi:hypothetical protein
MSRDESRGFEGENLIGFWIVLAPKAEIAVNIKLLRDCAR